MTRKEAFIAQRTKELRAAGKPVNVAQLEARFNELNATDAGKAQIAEKVALFNGPAKTPLLPPAPATAPAPTPTTTPTTYDPTQQTVVPTSEARVNTGQAPAPAPTPAATNSIPGFTFGAAAAAAAAPKPLTPQQAAATYGTFKEALAAMHPAAVAKYTSDGTGLSANEAKALQAQFPNLYKEFANKPGGLGGALPSRIVTGSTPTVTPVPYTTGETTSTSSTTPSGSTTSGTESAAPGTATDSGATNSGQSGESLWEKYQRLLNESNEKNTAEFNNALAKIKAQMDEQATKAYNEQKLLTAEQIRLINEGRAGLERDFQNRRAMTMGDIANLQSAGRGQLSQVLRDFAAGRKSGLLGLASRNRGIDPSASRRFINEANTSQAAALGATQAGTFGQVSRLRQQLEQDERDKATRLADLSRMSTYLGTSIPNYFPGVS